MRGVSASSSQSSTLLLHCLESKTQVKGRFEYAKSQQGVRFTRREVSPCLDLRCNSSTGPGGPTSGDRDSKSVLDAFFLGKALAEALNERVESAVGEFLGAIGRLQAEQQKQIQEFQDDVLERARKAKEQAAQEALEAQGLISKPDNVDMTSAADNTSLPSTYAAIPIDTASSTTSNTEADADPVTKGSGSTLGATNDD